MMEPVIIGQVRGYTPAFDARRSNETFVLAGRNYMVDSLGVRSAFATRLLSPVPLSYAGGAQTLRIDVQGVERVFLMTHDALLEYDSSIGDYKVLMTYVTIRNRPYRWTIGFLNRHIFFCHPSVGVLYLNTQNGGMGYLNVEGLTKKPLALGICNGRLIIVDKDYLYWSAPFNGFNFTPALGGAGFQQIKQHVPGDAIIFTVYSRGVLTWTTDGVMRSEITNDQVVFRHRAVDIDYEPINSMCITHLDDGDTTVMLDRRGLMATKGDTPEPFAPVFNEFLLDYIRRNRLDMGNNLRLEYSDDTRTLFISVSFDLEGPKYGKAFALYVPLDTWGEFSDEHYGLGAVNENQFGMIDSSRFLRRFHWGAGSDSAIQPAAYDLVRGESQASTFRKPNSSQVVGSTARFSTRDESAFSKSGFYAPEAIGPGNYEQVSVNSFVRIGLIRATNMESHDTMVELHSIQIGSSTSRADNDSTDWMTEVPDELDFNLISTGIDLGENPVSFSDFALRVLPTIDGQTLFGDAAIPTLERFANGSRYFSCTAVGLWHMLEFSATEANQSFHAKSIELTMTPAGKLN